MSLRARGVAALGGMIGVFASAYLLVDYVFGSGICLTGSGCDAVRASPFAHPFGIPMPLFGLVFYLAALVMLLATADRFPWPLGRRSALVAWSSAGVAVMVVLTLIELLVIRAFCSWCLLSGLASLLLAAGAVAAWRTEVESDARDGRSARARRRDRHAQADRERTFRRFTLITGALLSLAFIGLLVAPALSEPMVRGNSLAIPDRPTLGHGSVQVVVFSDFQCPACAATAPLLRGLADGGSITLTYRFFPLTSIHTNALAAARAAAAAELQGRFWEFHDRLFAGQATWADMDGPSAGEWFTSAARDSGLDVERWRQEMGSGRIANLVDADLREATDLRLRGTPSIFIDGSLYAGALDSAALDAAVHDAAGR
jgi:protein-disulfide isomerase